MKKFVFQSKRLKRFVPFLMGSGKVGVLDRQTGELTTRPDGEDHELPEVWANHLCNQLNKRPPP